MDIELLTMAQEYARKGYVVLRDLLSPQLVADLRSASERVFAAQGVRDDFNIRAEARRDVDGSWVVDRLDPVVDLSPTFVEAVSQPRLLLALRELIGGQPQLLKCKLIRKDPSVQGYAAHQDYLYWRWLETHPDQLCSVAIAIFDADVDSGGIELFPALHRAQIPGADGSLEADCDLAELGALESEVPSLRAGDALIFHSLSPHRSGPNTSAHPRTVLLPSYISGAEPDIYLKYYRREIERRVRDYVGFEHFDQQHNHMLTQFAQANSSVST